MWRRTESVYLSCKAGRARRILSFGNEFAKRACFQYRSGVESLRPLIVLAWLAVSLAAPPTSAATFAAEVCPPQGQNLYDDLSWRHYQPGTYSPKPFPAGEFKVYEEVGWRNPQTQTPLSLGLRPMLNTSEWDLWMMFPKTPDNSSPLANGPFLRTIQQCYFKQFDGWGQDQELVSVDFEPTGRDPGGKPTFGDRYTLFGQDGKTPRFDWPSATYCIYSDELLDPNKSGGPKVRVFYPAEASAAKHGKDCQKAARDFDRLSRAVVEALQRARDGGATCCTESRRPVGFYYPAFGSGHMYGHLLGIYRHAAPLLDGIPAHSTDPNSDYVRFLEHYAKDVLDRHLQSLSQSEVLLPSFYLNEKVFPHELGAIEVVTDKPTVDITRWKKAVDFALDAARQRGLLTSKRRVVAFLSPTYWVTYFGKLKDSKGECKSDPTSGFLSCKQAGTSDEVCEATLSFVGCVKPKLKDALGDEKLFVSKEVWREMLKYMRQVADGVIVFLEPNRYLPEANLSASSKIGWVQATHEFMRDLNRRDTVFVDIQDNVGYRNRGRLLSGDFKIRKTQGFGWIESVTGDGQIDSVMGYGRATVHIDVKSVAPDRYEGFLSVTDIPAGVNLSYPVYQWRLSSTVTIDGPSVSGSSPTLSPYPWQGATIKWAVTDGR